MTGGHVSVFLFDVLDLSRALSLLVFAPGTRCPDHIDRFRKFEIAIVHSTPQELLNFLFVIGMGDLLMDIGL